MLCQELKECNGLSRLKFTGRRAVTTSGAGIFLTIAPMEFSKHNIFSKIAGTENYYIVNPLSGQADILDSEEAEMFSNGSFIDQQ